MREIIEASHAVSDAVRMVKPAVIAAYPITPQTHIVERLSEMVANGELESKYINSESEFAAISSCLGSSATGVRSYTATSSQGLALMNEMLYIVSGMRLPVCMTVANRALSAPINIWNDHSDTMSVRDSGWIQLYAETAQECFDLTLMQFKISEDKRVLTPSMVCLDGFTLTHVYEPIDLPAQAKVDEFLPKYKPVHAVLDPEDPLTLGAIGFPTHYMESRAVQHRAINESLAVIKEVYDDFSGRFKAEIKGTRPDAYDHVERYRMDDAETVLVALGSVCGTIKDVIDERRANGEKVGLLKLVTFRPFPKESILKALKNAKRIAVVEKAFSPGLGGVIYYELSGLLYESQMKPKVKNFIVGLGGRDVTLDHVRDIIKSTMEDKGPSEQWMF
ncbi:MAG: transketolase C-terminal domain-containing protein [Candidatus Altiarchaeota archaeon]|nr:transketolase C-terminal domain-containing protein [Candidatus Altiarchaeota archaeon]